MSNNAQKLAPLAGNENFFQMKATSAIIKLTNAGFQPLVKELNKYLSGKQKDSTISFSESNSGMFVLSFIYPDEGQFALAQMDTGIPAFVAADVLR